MTLEIFFELLGCVIGLIFIAICIIYLQNLGKKD